MLFEQVAKGLLDERLDRNIVLKGDLAQLSVDGGIHVGGDDMAPAPAGRAAGAQAVSRLVQARGRLGVQRADFCGGLAVGLVLEDGESPGDGMDESGALGATSMPSLARMARAWSASVLRGGCGRRQPREDRTGPGGRGSAPGWQRGRWQGRHKAGSVGCGDGRVFVVAEMGPGCGGGLRIEVEYDGAAAGLLEGDGEVERQGGLAGAALLGNDRNGVHACMSTAPRRESYQGSGGRCGRRMRAAGRNGGAV